MIFSVIVVTLFPGRANPPVCDFLCDCSHAVSGAESGTEEVSASHRNRDCVALLDIGSARCPESSVHMGKAFEQEEGALLISDISDQTFVLFHHCGN